MLVVVNDPERDAALATERLALLFDLTPAESRLTAALAGGATIDRFARECALSEHTMRWTLKRLVAKTECTRRGRAGPPSVLGSRDLACLTQSSAIFASGISTPCRRPETIQRFSGVVVAPDVKYFSVL